MRCADDASGKYHTPRRVYNEMYRIFGKIPDPVRFPDLVITEDSNYLSDATRNEVNQYSKTRLSDYYKTAGNIDRIISVLPACIKDLIEGL